MHLGKTTAIAGLIGVLLVAGSSPVAIAVYYRYQDEPTSDFIYTEEFSCFAFLYDDQDVAHFFVALKGETDDVLVHYIHDGEFHEPDELFTMPGGADDLIAVECPDGSFCLLWQGRNAAIDCLYFTRLFKGEVDPPVEIPTGGLWNVAHPSLAVDADSQAHVAFSTGEATIGYARMTNGVFEPTRFLAVFPGVVPWPRPVDLAAAPDGLVYFTCVAGDTPYVFRFDGTHFSYPIPVSDLFTLGGTFDPHPCWILVDSTGTLHLLFNARHERAAGFTEIEGTYVKGTLEGGFGPPQAIDHDEWAYWWRRPVLDDQGVLHVAGARNLQDDYNSYQRCWHFFDAGLGFGNTREGCFAPNPPDGAWTFFDVKRDGTIGFGRSGLNVLALEMYVLSPDSLQADLSVGNESVTYEDVIFLDLNLYNPGPAILHGSLEIMFDALITWPDYPLYLTADPVYPTFTTEPYVFLFDLGPGEGLQHLPLLWIDLSVVGPYGLPDFDARFLLTLREASSGQVLWLDSAPFWYYAGS